MLKNNYSGKVLEAGVDEAGRGCLAGPVVAAAVILPPDFHHPLLNDSKQLNPEQRELLKEIIEKEALSYAIASSSNEEIDRLNILKATFKAMKRAVQQLKIKPEFIIIDGNRFQENIDISFQCIVKGDSLYASIAAASVLAKTTRDRIMVKLHHEFPYYCWDKNKGYPTVEHRQGIAKHGISPYHRKSFRLFPEGKQMKIHFKS